MTNLVILLDGPKGSGKSTLCSLLREHLSHADFLSLDEERKRLASAVVNNPEAFEQLIKKARLALHQGKNVVIDSGVTEERLHLLEILSGECDAHLYKFSLIAPRDVLLSRVQARDAERGRGFDRDRFDFTLAAQQSKSFEGYITLDSEKLSPQQMLEIVLSVLQEQKHPDQHA